MELQVINEVLEKMAFFFRNFYVSAIVDYTGPSYRRQKSVHKTRNDPGNFGEVLQRKY